jgi:hypothetical protein
MSTIAAVIPRLRRRSEWEPAASSSSEVMPAISKALWTFAVTQHESRPAVTM